MPHFIRFIRALTTIMRISNAIAATIAATHFGQVHQTRRKAAAVIFAALVWCVVMTPANVAAQDVRNTQNAADSKNRSGAQVDPATGAMQLQIPLGEYKGRGGTSLPITLSYSSKLWTMRYLNSITFNGDVYNRYQPKYAEESASGWTSSLDWFMPSPRNCTNRDCPPSTLHDNWYNSNGKNVSGAVYEYAVARMYFTLPDGSRHELRRSDTKVAAPGDATTGTFYSVDGSRLRYDSATRTLSMPDGSRYAVSTDQNGVPAQYSYTDRNGNVLAAPAGGTLTDTLGRTFSAPPLSNSAPGDYTYSLPGVGGTSLSYTIRWRNLADVLTDPSQALRLRGDRMLSDPRLGSGGPSLFTSPTGEEAVTSNGSQFNPVVLSQIVLPNGMAYTFTYNVWGEIDKIVTPTGAVETFTYAQVQSVSGQMEGELYGQTNRGVTARSVIAAGAPTSTWTYGTGMDTSIIPYRLTRTIKAPDNSFTEILYHTSRGADIKYGFDDARAGKAYDERVYAYQNGPMLRRTLTEWMYTGPVPFDNNSTATRDARVSKQVDILLDTGGNALAATTTYGYDADLNVTSTNRYGYASVDPATAQTGAITSIPQGALLRTEETDYLTNNQAYRDRNMLGLPTATRVKNAGSNIVAQSQMFYDETPLTSYGAVTNWSDPGTAVRGNPTRTSSWIDTSGAWVETRAEYDQCGNALKSIDARGNQSQVEYSSTYAYAYPTHTVSAVPDPTGAYGSNTSLEAWTAYDASTGLVTSTTDANNQTTYFQYNDPLNRLKLVTRPGDTAPGGGGHTSYDYNDTLGNIYVRTATSLDASRSIESYQFFDGLGRPSRSFLNEWGTPITFITSDTQYDQMGRVWRVSNPYRTNGSNDPVNPTNRWTTTAYDALGRPVTVTTPDGAVVQSVYSGNYVTVTDQAGKVRRSQTDALGRLTRVDEPDASGNLGTTSAPAQATSYIYDVTGNLRKVDQGGQLRFFMYDSLGRLIRAKNPEQAAGSVVSNITDTVTGNNQWSLAYGYDPNGNLTARVDARDITTNYTYDNLNRNTNVTYTGGGTTTPAVSRYYDGATLGRGRMYWQQAAGVSATAFDAYDVMGRPTQYRQNFWVSGAWGQAFTVKPTYNLAGAVTAETYPSGRTVSYGYDAAGRVNSFTGNIGDGVTRTYSTGITYSEMGGVQQEQFGTQTPLYHKLHYNRRGQLFDVRLSTNSLASNEWDWNRGAIVNYYGSNYAWEGDPSTPAGADNNGNLMQSQHWVPNDDAISGYSYTQERYTYDSLNRLKSVTEQPGTNTSQGAQAYVQAFDYDRWGNRTVNAAGTTGVAAPQFTVDAATNRLGVPAGQPGVMSYDAAGNLTADSYKSYGSRTYDAENRMTQAQDSYQQWSSYAYDADGHRVKRTTANEEWWQVYGIGGELVGEYRAGAAPMTATKEYGYRSGELLVTMASGDDQRVKRFVQNLYYGALQRDPTTQELSDKSSQLATAGAQGQTQLLDKAKEIARSLFTSTSYETSPYRSDTQYVADLYYAYLQRGPDDSGLGWWVGQAASSRTNVCNAFEGSSELATLVNTLYGTATSDNERTERVVNDFYLGAMGRNATSTELQQQRDALNTAAAQGQSQVKDQAEAMGRSLFAAQVTDLSIPAQQFVTNLYEGFLQRGPDAGGLSYWTGVAGSTAQTRQNVLNAFATSGAFRELSGTLYRETFWMVSDHLGTPRMVVDRSGSLAGVKRHDYLPFGEELLAGTGGRTVQQGYGASDNVRQKFTSKERDAETGLDYFLARYYSSAQGRFISPDEFTGGPDELYDFVDDAAENPTFYAELTNPQSLNKYQYAYNNPLRYVDPNGHEPDDLLDQDPKPAPLPTPTPPLPALPTPPTPRKPYGVQLDDAQRTKERLDNLELDYKCEHGDAGSCDKLVPPIPMPPLLPPAPQAPPSPTASKKGSTKPRKERSPHPPGRRERFNTRKRAEEAARRAGRGRKPVNHPNDPHGPHFHPADKNGRPLNHDHYFYPKRWAKGGIREG